MSVKENKFGYKPFAEWRWRSYDGHNAVVLQDFVNLHNQDDYFFIGTDSQNYSKKQRCVFTSVLIAYRLHKGGSVVLHRNITPYMPALRQRLLMEAMRSLEVAWWLNDKVPSQNVISIHLDVNPSVEFESGKYKNELVGLVVAQGFKCFTKPDAFGASKVADHKC
jgi:predicted RNase H-related nuclease YkuK (DUF458 family)